MDILDHNREAWNREVSRGNNWTIPVDSRVIEEARNDRSIPAIILFLIMAVLTFIQRAVTGK